MVSSHFESEGAGEYRGQVGSVFAHDATVIVSEEREKSSRRGVYSKRAEEIRD